MNSNTLQTVAAGLFFCTALIGMSTASHALSPAEVGAMHNNCNHPNYQGDRSRCGGGGGGWSGEYDYFYMGFAWGKDTKTGDLVPYFYRHYRLSARTSIAPQWVFNDIEAITMQKCNQAYSGSCEYEAGYVNSCVSVATNTAEGFYTWKDAGYKMCSEVKREALAACQRNSKQSPQSCKIIETKKSPTFWNR